MLLGGNSSKFVKTPLRLWRWTRMTRTAVEGTLDRLKGQPELSRGKHTRNQDNTKVNIFAGTRRLGIEGLRGPGVLGYVRCSGPHFLVFFLFKGFFQVS